MGWLVNLLGFQKSNYDLARAGRTARLAKRITSGDVNRPEPDGAGWTLLHIAAQHGNMGLAELLAAKGASPTATNDDGETPLHVAGATWTCGTGRTVSVESVGGVKIRTMAFKELKSDDCLGVAKLLLENGADVNARDENGNTPLKIAINSGKEDMIEFLLAHGADANAPDN